MKYSIDLFNSKKAKSMKCRVRTGPGKPGKPWRISEALEIPGKTLEKPWNFFIKPWKISQNFIEKINSRNGAFY